jgi:ectoine hydroxylase-related dioxygenase (phytanoyl-CoA dioxygenase family)
MSRGHRKEDDEVSTYAITERTKVVDDTDRHVESLRCNGFTVMPAVFSGEEMARAARLIDQIYELQKNEMAAEADLSGSKEEDLIRCPLAYAEEFVDICANKVILAVMTRLLGESYVLLMQNVIINRASTEHYQTRWHRDLNYQHWTSSRPIAVNFLVCVDRFFKDGGATWVLPGSHRYDRFPSDEFVRSNQISIEADPGSVILLDAMTFHRAGRNTTDGFVRRGVNHVVGMPFMAQQIDIPQFLAARGRDCGADPFLSMYLGYRWRPAPDPLTWRRQRLDRWRRAT